MVDIDDDDDWLPPPPQVSSDAQKSIDEDSTLKKLRLSAFYSSHKFSCAKLLLFAIASIFVYHSLIKLFQLEMVASTGIAGYACSMMHTIMPLSLCDEIQ